MRVALCLAGQPRSARAAWPSIKANIVDKYPTDVFYHFWSTPMESYGIPPGDFRPAFEEKWKIPYEVEEDISFRDLEWLYDPVDFELQEQIYGTEGFPWGFASNHIFISNIPHAYSVKKSIGLALKHAEENDFKYDFIVKMRPDIYFYNHESLDNLNGLDQGKLYVPRHHNFKGLNDHFALGSQAVMAAYAGFYDYIDEEIQSGRRVMKCVDVLDDVRGVGPESLHRDFVLSTGMPVRRLRIGLAHLHENYTSMDAYCFYREKIPGFSHFVMRQMEETGVDQRRYHHGNNWER